MPLVPLSELAWTGLAAIGLILFGLTTVAAFLLGRWLIPHFQRLQFVSAARADEGTSDHIRTPQDLQPAPMGGAVLFLGATLLALLVLRVFSLVRWGYVICFLIPVLGFGLLGLWDDRDKIRGHGLDDRTKTLWHLGVAFTFSAAYWLYAERYLPGVTPGALTLPNGDEWQLGIAYVFLLAVFFFLMANAVNFTDGFNGLAGGCVMLVCLGYATLSLWQGWQHAGHGHHQPTVDRFNALYLIGASLAGGCLGFLIHNWPGRVIMGDTGSMALGAAIVFMAVFTQTEWWLPVMAGAITVDGLSTILQRGWGMLLEWVRPLERGFRDPWRPFIIAPLHHHFEVLALRAWEASLQASTPTSSWGSLRRRVRGQITVWAWLFTFITVGVGLLARHQQSAGLWWLGVGLIALPLLQGIATRVGWDCYFIGATPGTAEPVLCLYRGIPWELGPVRCYHLYETTDIPLRSLSYLQQRTLLYRVFTERIDARLIMGSLLYQQAQQTEPEEMRRRLLQDALAFWNRVPLQRFLLKGRHPVLFQWAEAAQELTRFGEAFRVLAAIPPHWMAAREQQRVTAVQEEAWRWAERLWWEVQPALEQTTPLSQEAHERMEAAAAAHRELETIIEIRQHRLRQRYQRINQEMGELAAAQAKEDEEQLTQIGRLERERRLLEEEGQALREARTVILSRQQRLNRALAESPESTGPLSLTP